MKHLGSLSLAAVLASARKDLLLMRRYPMSLAARIIDPISWLVPVYFLGRTFSRGREAVGFAAWSGTGDFMSYLIVGWVVSAYVVSVLWGMSFSLKNEMDVGVLEANWVTPFSPLLLLVGRALASMTITTVGTCVFGVLAASLFGFSIPGQILPAISLILPVIIGLYGIGFILAGVVLRMKGDANSLIDFSNFVLELVSGRDFPVVVLPLPLFLVALLLPLT